MEDNMKLIESLFEKTAEFGRTGLRLVKLKTLDKSSDAISSLIPHMAVILIIASFLLFLSIGLAFWIGEILDNTYYGFFAVAGFYAISGLIVHFFIHKWLKKLIGNYIVKRVLN